MYSFYGGKLGRTYHIVKKFSSIKEMTDSFKEGDKYTEVMYHLYVLIDTTLVPYNDQTKQGGVNDFENGRLYRRGFNFGDTPKSRPSITLNGTIISNESDLRAYWENPGAGAIYVGCIRGSDGGGVLLVDPTSQAHEITVAEGGTVTGNNVVVGLTSTAQLNGPTKYTLDFDFPIPYFKTPTVNTLTTSTVAKVTLKGDSEDYLINSTFDIPQGIYGKSVTNIEHDKLNHVIFTVQSYKNAAGTVYGDVTTKSFALNYTRGVGLNSSSTDGAYDISNLPNPSLGEGEEQGLIYVKKDNKYYLYGTDGTQWHLVQDLESLSNPSKVIIAQSSLNATDSAIQTLSDKGFILQTQNWSYKTFGEIEE